MPYFWSAVAVGLAALVGLALTSQIRLPNVSMIFLLAVLFSAARFGMGPALFSSLLSFLAYNFFFIEPLHTFSVTEPHELLSLFVLLVAAILTSAIASRMRNEARRAAEKDRASRRLYKFARHLSRAADENAVARHGAMQIHHILRRSCVVSWFATTHWIASPFGRPNCPGPGNIVGSGTSPAGRGSRRRPTGGRFRSVAVGSAEYLCGAGRNHRACLVGRRSPRCRREHPFRDIGGIDRQRAGAGTTRPCNLVRKIGDRDGTPAQYIPCVHQPLIFARPSRLFWERPPRALSSTVQSCLGLTRRDLLDQVKDEAEHLDGMVRDLLSLTRLEAGALELHREYGRSKGTARPRRRGSAASGRHADLPG